MQRSKRRVRVGAAARWTAIAAAGMAAVAACGPLRLGAAATYGNQRLTQAQLDAQVSNLNTAYLAGKSKLSLSYTPADMPRRVLSWMLTFATMDQLAASRHVTVTPAQAQAAAKSLSASAAQSGLSLNDAAVEAALPPDLLGAYEQFAVAQSKVSSQLGNPTTQAGQAAAQAKFSKMVCQAAKGLAISVNPQYGAFSYKTFAVLATASTLTEPPGGSGLPAPTAAQFKPAC